MRDRDIVLSAAELQAAARAVELHLPSYWKASQSPPTAKPITEPVAKPPTCRPLADATYFSELTPRQIAQAQTSYDTIPGPLPLAQSSLTVKLTSYLATPAAVGC